MSESNHAPSQFRSPLPPGSRWSILCRVIDNFGDAGVCWRLARQLAREHRASVTLYIDTPGLVSRLAGGPGPYEGVVVRGWPGERSDGASEEPCPPEVIVSAFGADPPPHLRRLLAGAPQRPLWVNLEYLSAEPWIDGCHGLSSLKNEDGAREHFFYPGFTPASGGLLRERDALASDEDCAPAARAAVLERLALPAPAPGERLFTLFCYPDAPLAHWLPELATGPQPTLLLIPEGVASEPLLRFAGRSLDVGHGPLRHARLRLARIPFLSQDDYDSLLRVADLNVVRGEDSWLRAHWARRPFIWQPYRQDEGAHRVKLEAFLDRFRAALAKDESGDALAAFESLAAVMRAWAGDGPGYEAGHGRAHALRGAWRELEARRRVFPLDELFRRWTDHLLEQPDLASNLARWLARRL